MTTVKSDSEIMIEKIRSYSLASVPLFDVFVTILIGEFISIRSILQVILVALNITRSMLLVDQRQHTTPYILEHLFQIPLQ